MVSKREDQAISSSKGVCITWRQLSARHKIDKADTWFSLRSSPAYNEMLWKRNVQAVRVVELQSISNTLRSVYALQADVCETLIEARYTRATL